MHHRGSNGISVGFPRHSCTSLALSLSLLINSSLIPAGLTMRAEKIDERTRRFSRDGIHEKTQTKEVCCLLESQASMDCISIIVGPGRGVGVLCLM